MRDDCGGRTTRALWINDRPPRVRGESAPTSASSATWEHEECVRVARGDAWYEYPGVAGVGSWSQDDFDVTDERRAFDA
jgi:hypothetical protein